MLVEVKAESRCDPGRFDPVLTDFLRPASLWIKNCLRASFCSRLINLSVTSSKEC